MLFSIILIYSKVQRQSCIGEEYENNFRCIEVERKNSLSASALWSLEIYQSRDYNESLEKKWDFFLRKREVEWIKKSREIRTDWEVGKRKSTMTCNNNDKRHRAV